MLSKDSVVNTSRMIYVQGDLDFHRKVLPIQRRANSRWNKRPLALTRTIHVKRPGDDNRFAVLMMPFAETPPEVEFTAEPSPPGTAVVCLRRGQATDWLVFGNGDRLVLLQGRLVTDGAFAWVGQDDQGRCRGILVKGQELTWDGQPLPGPDN